MLFTYFRPQRRYYLYTLGPNVGVIYVLGSLGVAYLFTLFGFLGPSCITIKPKNYIRFRSGH